MDFNYLSKENSKSLFDEYCLNGLPSIYSNLSPFYDNIRKTLLEFSKEMSNDYQFDIKFAIKLYSYFQSINGFNELVASNYEFWMYISLKVVPDIINKRHGMISSYYYEKNVRIYLSGLWWYVHLSYQKDLQSTYDLLSKLNSDYLLQLTERPGREGSYIELTRRIMYYIGILPMDVRNHRINDAILFRRVMMQNTARINNYNLLLDDKCDEYVNSLFKNCGVDVSKYE